MPTNRQSPTTPAPARTATPRTVLRKLNAAVGHLAAAGPSPDAIRKAHDLTVWA
jgi:hypothetical protein